MISAPRERRVTPWKALWFDSPGFTHVRIWQEFDGLRWWQMHEWQRADGSTDVENGWIRGAAGWCHDATPPAGPAPGDAPVLSAEEIAYLVERLAGVNDPVGVSARAKLEAALTRRR